MTHYDVLPEPEVGKDAKQRRSLRERAALPKAQSTSTSSVEPAESGCDYPPGLSGAGEASQSTRSHVAGWIAPTIAPTGRTADILRVLSETPTPCAVEHLTTTLGVHRAALHAPLKELMAAGKVTKTGKGGKTDPARYTLHTNTTTTTEKETDNGSRTAQEPATAGDPR